MITFEELKKVLSLNTYTLKVNTGCDYEIIDSLELSRDNELYHAFDDCIVEEVDIYEDEPESNEIILHSLYYDDETGEISDAVTGEIIGHFNPDDEV